MSKTQSPQDKSFGYRFAMLQPSLLPFIISLVRQEAPVTQECLSNHPAVDKGTTARAIGRLEKKGYVRREINPKNRRGNRVWATPKAHAVSENLLTSLTRASDTFFEGFTNKENSIRVFLDRMLSNARKAVTIT